MNERRVVTNFIWRFLERFGAQAVTLLLSLVLARLLDPSVYGAVALVSVITGILQVFVDSGLGTALVQKKDADDLDFSSVFYFNAAVCVLLYGALFLCAPLIAAFYELPELTALIRVLGLTLVISGVKNIQQAYVSRNMLFKRFFYATLAGTLGAAVVGIWMAMRGFGAWALVAQSLFNNTVDTLVLWFTVKWRPRRMFSFRRLKGLLSFSWKLLVGSLLESLQRNLQQLVIGKAYTTEDLAFYNKGRIIPEAIVPNIDSALRSVLFPLLSVHQDRRETVRGLTRRAIRTGAFLIFPAMVGLSVCGEALIRLVLTEKWLPCLPFLYVFCADFALWPISTANGQAINALGRSDISLKIDVVRRTLGILVVLVSVRYGVMVMACSVLALNLAAQALTALPVKRLLDYSYWQQLRDIFPSAALSAAMGACVWCVRLPGWSDAVTLLVQIPLGVIVYVAGAYLLRMESFLYLLDLLKRIRKQKDE